MKATGQTAQVSAQQIQAFAATRQGITNFSDEVTTGAAAILTGFKQIQGDTFLQTITLAQDLSALTGSALPESMKKLAVAINDPIAGVAGLNEIGVKFTAQQLEQMRVLQESGQLHKAQAMVIKELQNTIGGTAEATADPLAQMMNLTADVAANISQLLYPSLRELYTGLKQGVDPLMRNKAQLLALGETIAVVTRYLVSWGKYIVVVGVGLGAYAVAVHACRIATLAWAQANLIWKASSGPIGWVALAAGAVLYGTAMFDVASSVHAASNAKKEIKKDIDALEKQKGLQQTAEAADNLAEATKKAAEQADKLGEKYLSSAVKLRRELQEIARMVQSGELTPAQGEFFSAQAVNAATGIQNRIQQVQAQIALANGQADEISIEIAQMHADGARPEELDQLDAALRELEQAKRDKAAREKQIADAERAKEEAEKQKNRSKAPVSSSCWLMPRRGPRSTSNRSRLQRTCWPRRLLITICS